MSLYWEQVGKNIFASTLKNIKTHKAVTICTCTVIPMYIHMWAYLYMDITAWMQALVEFSVLNILSVYLYFFNR